MWVSVGGGGSGVWSRPVLRPVWKKKKKKPAKIEQIGAENIAHCISAGSCSFVLFFCGKLAAILVVAKSLLKCQTSSFNAGMTHIVPNRSESLDI